MKLSLEEAKDRVLIPELWYEFGYAGRPGVSCYCPFHENTKTPAFSVSNEGQRWKCYNGCGGGDVIDFLAKARNISNAAACREIAARTVARSYSPSPLSVPPTPRRKDILPHDVHSGTPDDSAVVARLRRLSIEAVEAARVLTSTLKFGTVCGHFSWILTDASGLCAEARRMDGKPYPAVGTLSKRKTHTLAGSRKNWPVGIFPIAHGTAQAAREFCRKIVVVEGGPDYLAALHFMHLAGRWDILPVAILGRQAASHIHPEALPYFAGNHVRIYPHADADEGGMAAARRWAGQIMQAGAKYVDLFDFRNLKRRDGKPVNDLNDAVVIHADEQHQLAGLLP